MGARRYEELEIWKLARELNGRVYRLTSEDPFSRDFTMTDQIRRASLSVMCNIAEGFGRDGPKQFKRFLDIARSSCLEVQSLIYAASDQGYLQEGEFDQLYGLCSKLYAKICSLMRHLRTQIERAA